MTHILPLTLAEPRHLQALVSGFRLVRDGQGIQLRVEVRNDCDAIWTNHGKAAARGRIRNFSRRAEKLQMKLDKFFCDEQSTEFVMTKGDNFPFRYGSGGTLPIVNLQGYDYYVLFYREIGPIGWNIANGGFESRHEMLHPDLAIERELREELIAIHPTSRERRRFSWAQTRPMDRPEYGSAHDLWGRELADMKYSNFQDRDIELSWAPAPDIVEASVGGEGPIVTADCFVNVNALDFGIEIDRVAHMKFGRFKLPNGVSFLDGELHPFGLINAPVGLFRKDKLDHRKMEFMPDYLFYSGRPCNRTGKTPRRTIIDVIEKHYVPRIMKNLSRKTRGEYSRCERKYDLCPATRGIIRRYSSTRTSTTPCNRHNPSVFISYSSADNVLAGRLYADLREQGFHCWKYDFDLEIGDPIRKSIENAIRRHDYVIAILSKTSIQSEWVRHEVDEALKKEKRLRVNILRPIRLDDSVFEDRLRFPSELVDSTRDGRWIADFTKWKMRRSYEKALRELIRSMRQNEWR